MQPGKDGYDEVLVDKMPSLMKLKNAIYSPEYRSFVERITGLSSGTLTEEVRAEQGLEYINTSKLLIPFHNILTDFAWYIN